MSTPSILESASAIESALSALRVACRGMVVEGSDAGAKKVELEQLAAAALEDRDPPFDLVDRWRPLTTTWLKGVGPQTPYRAMNEKVI